MEYKVLLKDKLHTIVKLENEPLVIFSQRINFIVKGLTNSRKNSFEFLTTLSLCYRNIIQYNVEYESDINKMIDEIIE
jgi:hypothetical protein